MIVNKQVSSVPVNVGAPKAIDAVVLGSYNSTPQVWFIPYSEAVAPVIFDARRVVPAPMRTALQFVNVSAWEKSLADKAEVPEYK